jgi:lambda family phage minor tail protein L
MGVRSDTGRLKPLSIVEMFVWDDTVIGGANVIRWHPGTTGVAENIPITWQGLTYLPIPIEAAGFEMTGTGKLPRPTLRITNIGGEVGAFLRSINDGLGAKITRKRTLGKYLDAVNFPDGNPDADPNTAFVDEIFYVARKARENPIFIELELAVKFDVEGTFLPRRQVIAGTCQWVYRSAECSYAGDPVLTDPIYPGVDRCGKTLTSCKLRFGEFGVLRTSAFPASMLARYE